MNTTTRNRKTGSQITLINDGELWILNCDSHEQCCEFDTLREVKIFRAAPENFCSACADVLTSKAVA